MKHINSNQTILWGGKLIKCRICQKEIQTVLEEAYYNNTITKEKLVAINTEGKNASKCSANFKDHKEN